MYSTDPEFQHLIGIILNEAIVEAVIQSVFYGIFLALILFSTYTLLQKEYMTKMNIAMLAITLFMFAISTTVWALSLASIVQSVKIIHLSDPTRSSEDISHELDRSRNALYGSATLVFVINFILSDCIVLWRASVLWQGSKRKMIIPFCLLLGCGIAVAIILADCDRSSYKANAFCIGTKYIGLGLSLSVNMLATILIGITAWRHRRFIMNTLEHSSRRTQVEKILILLIESSVLYCLAFVMLIVCSSIRLPSGLVVSQYMWPISTHIAGIYPTILLLLVAFKRTIWDSRGNAPQVIMSDIRYASGGVTGVQQRRASDRDPSSSECVRADESKPVSPIDTP